MAEIRMYPGKSYFAPVQDEFRPFRAFYCSGTGTVVLEDDAGNTISFPNLVEGIVHPLGGNKTLAGTTATIICIAT